jgi:hypothetical protein
MLGAEYFFFISFLSNFSFCYHRGSRTLGGMLRFLFGDSSVSVSSPLAAVSREMEGRAVRRGDGVSPSFGCRLPHSVPVPVSLLTDFSCVVFVALDVGVKHIAFHRSNSIAGLQDAVLMLEFYHEHGWFLIITFHIAKCLFYHDLFTIIYI